MGDSEQAIARLKSAAEMELDAPQIVAPGESATVTVTITNVGAGHYLPTGLTEVRQMWLEVTAEAADGTTTTVGERRFGTVLKDKDGNAPAELWDAVGIESDDRIPPRESATSTYTVTMPAGAEKSTLKAALYYKSVPDELAEKAGVENPTTEMVAAAQPFFASQEAMAADSAQQETTEARRPVDRADRGARRGARRLGSVRRVRVDAFATAFVALAGRQRPPRVGRQQKGPGIGRGPSCVCEAGAG